MLAIRCLIEIEALQGASSGHALRTNDLGFLAEGIAGGVLGAYPRIGATDRLGRSICAFASSDASLIAAGAVIGRRAFPQAGTSRIADVFSEAGCAMAFICEGVEAEIGA